MSEQQWVPPQLTVPTRLGSRKATWVVLAGCALVAVGSFLPWVKITVLFGTLSKDGIEGDGKLTLALAVLTAAVAWWGVKKIPTLACGLVLVAVAVFEFADAANRFARARAVSGLVHPSYGAGLYLVLLGSITICVGAVLAITGRLDR